MFLVRDRVHVSYVDHNIYIMCIWMLVPRIKKGIDIKITCALCYSSSQYTYIIIDIKEIYYKFTINKLDRDRVCMCVCESSRYRRFENCWCIR